MKLKFKNQEFQSIAVDAVADLFKGQEKSRATFSIENYSSQTSLFNEFGEANNRLIDDDMMLSNLHEVQKRNNLPLTSFDDEAFPQFSIEMETGTGKTYVYTKTIFEMNKRYGFAKFIIVVPSVAIREGVHKSLEVTCEHFASAYNNVSNRFFIYNSAKLSDVRQFATSGNIEIMIINIDAFKKAENIINQAHDKLNGESAIRYIADTNPIVIIDEPQSVDNTEKSKDAIASLNPMCVLRYSATHREKKNLVYRLTPVDAYNMGLVKQICVSSNSIENDFNKPYIKLLSVDNKNGFKAKIEIDVQNKELAVSRKVVTVKAGDDLYLLSKKRSLYDGYQVEGIDCTEGLENIEFSNTEVVMLGKAVGSIDEDILKEAQIRRTIETHLDKELRYYDKGIKVLSLFFIDKVAKYRTVGGEKGIYAQMFERCYNETIAKPKYAPIREKFSSDISTVHNGYFSQDKKGAFKDTKGDTQADDSTYNTIMKEKEWLLSFECPLRFIFSHSALKEGWDNPNVFQVCTLLEQKSVFTSRQKVGRGLRLCVDQDGNRIEDKNINVLHVMANESFADFANSLQKEIEEETGVKFGVLQLSMFNGLTYMQEVKTEHVIDEVEATNLVEEWTTNGQLEEWIADTEMMQAEAKISAKLASGEITAPINPALEVIRQHKMGASKEEMIKAIENITYEVVEKVEKEFSYEDASELMVYFEKKNYTTKQGNIKDTMKNALLNGTLDLPSKYEEARARIEGIIKQADNKPIIRDASREVTVKLNKQIVLSEQFKELWNKIKQKTTYRVDFDVEELIKACVKSISLMPTITKAKLFTTTASFNVEQKGVSFMERGMKAMELDDSNVMLPDIIKVLSLETKMKRADIVRILQESDRLSEFVINPQKFIEEVLKIIKKERHSLAIDGIKYMKLDGEEYYVQEIFGSEEIIANLDKNAVKVTNQYSNSVYDYVIYDSSTIEKPFALALDNDPDVKMFFKLPSSFKINTPIGTYNPDWAVYMTKNDDEKLYFVLETKGGYDLREHESLKNHCGEAHFKALGIDYTVKTNWSGFKKEIL